MNGFGGHLDSLQDMYQSSPHDSCVRKTTIAAAFLCLSRHYKSSALYSMACSCYNTAVRAVNRNPTSTSRSFKDETLMSILLLGMIEDIDSHSVKKSYHMLGIARTYEVAGQWLLSNIHKSKLEGMVVSDLQIPSLTADKALDCLAIPDNGLDTHNFYIRLSLVATRVGHFHRRAKQFSSSGVPKEPERRTLQRRKLLSFLVMLSHSCAGRLLQQAANTRDAPSRDVNAIGRSPTQKIDYVDLYGRAQKAIVMYRLIWPLAIVIASPQSTRQHIQDSRDRLDWIRDRDLIRHIYYTSPSVIYR
ncbi:hypothetical protein FAGAP_473 [Fusarium agapanthi]|uniref:Uncharacterized protein n=1 Tax=Fusarium agapanthi TaxID=1803897 RepID=A0A9P5BL33_9HYPO|nr:hypothetical protein FAGAP_473 [Fusarium agapanthi]